MGYNSGQAESRLLRRVRIESYMLLSKRADKGQRQLGAARTAAAVRETYGSIAAMNQPCWQGYYGKSVQKYMFASAPLRTVTFLKANALCRLWTTL